MNTETKLNLQDSERNVVYYKGSSEGFGYSHHYEEVGNTINFKENS